MNLDDPGKCNEGHEVDTTNERRATSSRRTILRAVSCEGSDYVPPHPAPSLEDLTRVLSTVLRRNALSGEVTVLDRKLTVYVSTFYSERVTCRLRGGSTVQVLCKHSEGDGHNCYGHRGGIPYEAEVYRSILARIQLTTPVFYGGYLDAERNRSWLIIEFLEDAEPVNHSLDPGAMMLAARWIGRFHALNEVLHPRAPMPLLNRYDAHYYLGWSHRTWMFATPLRGRYPWLADVCETYAKAVDWLLARQPTVIHGEYYPLNVLLARGNVYPVDWESAAVAAGEIDLAFLTEGWPEREALEMEVEYQQTRWPCGAPAGFEKTLAAARIYLAFRWLGDRPEWTTSEQCRSRFEQLHRANERWNALGAS